MAKPSPMSNNVSNLPLLIFLEVDSFLETFGSETAYLESEGEIVSQEETEKLFQDYINELEF